MKKALIGYTGFVGSNIDSKTEFDYKFNSKNINEIKGKSFDLIVCAGVRAQKWFANQYPQEDFNQIEELIKILEQVNTKKFVLISTIDIYKNPNNVNENTKIEVEGLHSYGRNRYYLEKWVENHFDNHLIVRLPALFGDGLKKNFIYDLINLIPSVIIGSKFDEYINKITLREKEIMRSSYKKDNHENYNFINNISDEDKDSLKRILKKIGFTSLVFTDYRSEFPFYFLDNLWKDINIAIESNITILNLAVEPISAKVIADQCFGIEFDNTIDNKVPLKYDMKTIYSDLYNKKSEYIYMKDEVLDQIRLYLKRGAK